MFDYVQIEKYSTQRRSLPVAFPCINKFIKDSKSEKVLAGSFYKERTLIGVFL